MAAIDVNGKVALVTGANRGIGKSIVEALLRAGATKVYAAVRRVETAAPLTEEFGDKVVPVAFDLTDDASIRAAAAKASDVEIVINNAGVLKTATTFSDDVFDAFAFELDTNVLGLMRTTRAFAPVLKSNGGGALVQLNSVASMKNFPEFTTYCASKAAAYSVTQALKWQLAEQGTTVVSVHPGPIATDMITDTGNADLVAAAESPSVVADAIVDGLKNGTFHIFPDTMAKQIGGAYEGFATNIVEADFSEG